MKKAKIAVIGSANVDLTTLTDCFPEPGETIFARDFHLGFGGKGANQAVAAKRCGADVWMIARVGDDLFGRATIENFTAMGIDTTYVRETPGVSSGVAPIFVDSTGQNRILVAKGANDKMSPADVDAAADVLRSADFLVMQLEIPVETVIYALNFASKNGIRSILNPAPGMKLNFEEIGAADYVIPNETEAQTLTRMPVANVAEAQICARYLRDAGMRRVIITLGAKGSIVASGAAITHVSPFQVNAIDTTGAGDAFIGSLAAFLANGTREEEAVRRASLYAALSTQSAGTQRSFVTAEEFEKEWERRKQ